MTKMFSHNIKYAPLKRRVIDYLYRRSYSFRNFIDNKSDNYLFSTFYNSKQAVPEHFFEGAVAICDGRMPLNATNIHGGLADRLKGFVSVYDVCKRFSIDFKIFHTFPYNLQDFLVPNRHDWTIGPDRISYNPKISEAHILRYLRIEGEENYHKWRLEHILKNNTPQKHIYTNLELVSEDRFRLLFDELFKPSPLLQNEIARYKTLLTDNYISVSLRFTHLLGDSIDEYMKELDDTSKELLIDRCIDAIQDVIHDYPSRWILVNSDSSRFLNKVVDCHLNYVFVIPGKPVHIDQVKNCDFCSILKTFVDFFMITHATKVILIKSTEMYNSAFPRYAALIGNKPFYLKEI